MKQRAAAAFAAVLLLPVHPAGARGQIRASEHAVVAQTIDGTTITVEYSRPAARGRELFGATVPWGQPWTGANWATTIAADRDFRLGGRDVPAGKYSLWLIPRRMRWTVFLDPNARLFHVQRPDSSPAQIRVEVEPEQGPHVELLTWSFPAVSGDGATLRMQWGTTSVRLPIVVQPTKPVAMTAEKRARYVGSYDMTIRERMGWPGSGRLDVFEADGLLRARLPFPIHPGDELEFDLIPAGEDRFNAGLYRDGKLFNVEMGAALEFDVGGGRATAVRLRAIEGTVFMEGRRSAGDASARPGA